MSPWFPFQALEKQLPENTQSPFRASPNPAPHKKTKVADKPVTPTTTTGTGTPSPAKDDPYAFQSPQPKMLFEEDASNELSLMTQRSHDDSEEEDIPDPELENATHHNSFYFQSIFSIIFQISLFVLPIGVSQVGDAL